MMVRSQISLSSESHARARARAAALDVSLAEYIRRLVDRDLAESPRRMDRSVVFDLGRSAGTDVASNKDGMLAEAIGAGKRRGSGVR